MYFFVLGADDPEMVEIERIVRSRGVCVYARTSGRRVHPANAYAADPIVMPNGYTPVFVECAPRRGRPNGSIVVDHHQPGDPGYGRKPAEFMAASSVGQVLRLLGIEPDLTQRFIAAADHCLGAAYRGLCPGIDPLSLREWRTRTRAKHQGRTPAAVRADQNASIAAIMDAPRAEVGIWTFRDVRGQNLPELAEGSAICGEGVLYATFDRRSQRTKVGVLNGPTEAIAAWLDWARSAASRLRDAYGDPARGYAGAYLD